MSTKKITIAAGQGFWGDWLEAPVRQIQGGQIDYLMLDYLAEVTMSVLAKQKEANPALGYARDFPQLIERILPDIIAKKTTVISNAGGLNPKACAEAIVTAARARQIPVKVAVVSGDDILTFTAKNDLPHLETNASLDTIRDRITSANAYIGSEPIVEALQHGAHIIITGRVADPSMVLGPMRFAFGWAEDDWNRLASGILAGHIIECGAQSSGGNFSGDWRAVADLAHIGFPIIEAYENGDFVVTKHPNTGGLVSQATVKEQMVYEIGDPTAYYTPDVIANFTTAELRDDGPHRVKITGVTGKARPYSYKVSISYFHGYRTVSTLVYSWPEAIAKAKAAAEILRTRISDLGLRFEKVHAEVVGANACHGPLTDRDNPEIPEVLLRFAVQGPHEKDVKRFTREMAPLVLGGPPFATAYSGGKGDVSEVYGYWPSLIPRSAVKPVVEYFS
jgi:phage tail protein X